MTEASAPNTPRTPREVSSNRLLRTTLLWSAIVTAGLAVVGAIVGFAVAGTSGLWSALVAVLLAAVFLGLTAGTILVANRWYGDPLYTPIFFGAVMGGWIVKFALFIVVLFVLRGAPWLNGTVFFVAWDATCIAAGVFVRGGSPLLLGVELFPHMPVEEPVFLAFLCHLALATHAAALRRAQRRRAARRTSDGEAR